MLPAGHLLAFALISFVLIVVPGPNVLFVISRSLMLGRAAGVGSAVGGQIGVYLQVAAVAFGVGALVERSVAVFTVIKLAGAAYLVYLGVQAVRHRARCAPRWTWRSEPQDRRSRCRDGIVVGVSNPKAIVFFAAVLPQFVDPSAGPCPAADAAARDGVHRHRGGVRQHLGGGRRDGPGLDRPLAAAAGTGRRRRAAWS